MATYGRRIEWTLDWSGGQRMAVEVNECATPDEATREVLQMALRHGWTPPRWWEFWRWQEPRVALEDTVPTARVPRE